MSRIALASFTILCLLSATSALIINPANANGTTYFNQTCGGTSNDHAYSVVQTVDGGYVLAGSTHSFGAGSYDFWLVKTDASGIPEFPTWTPLLLVTIFTVAITIYRRKLLKKQTVDMRMR